MRAWIKFEGLSGEGNPLEVSWATERFVHMTVNDATTVKLFFDTAYPDDGRAPAYITLTTTSGKSDEVHAAILALLTGGTASATSSSGGSNVSVTGTLLITINTSTTDVTALSYHTA
jgi:hypothetical protein